MTVFATTVVPTIRGCEDYELSQHEFRLLNAYKELSQTRSRLSIPRLISDCGFSGHHG